MSLEIGRTAALLTVVAVAGCSISAPAGRTGGEQGVAGQYYMVKLSAPPVGGLVTSSSGGMLCGASAVGVDGAVSPPQYTYAWYDLAAGRSSACDAVRVPWGEQVVLTATPRGGNAFLGWAGDCVGDGPTCTLSAGADKLVVAIFGAAGSAHTSFQDPSLHGPAYLSYAAGAASALRCIECHGVELQGQGIAPSCRTCHPWPVAGWTPPTTPTTPVTPTGPRAATTTALSGEATLAGAVALRATVDPVAATGWVSFADGGAMIGMGVVLGGTATLVTPALPGGSHTFTATYGGDSTYAASASAAAAVEVTAGSVGAGAYLLPSARVTLWRPGVTSNGGIPARTTLCASLSPRGGTLADTAAIQAAIDACPAGQAVKLSAGTFRLTSPGLELKSGVTLRGAGADQGGTTGTVLFQTDGTNAITIGDGWSHDDAWWWIGRVALAADAVKGTNSITLPSAPGVAVGEVVHLNETYDRALTAYTHAAQLDGASGGPGDYLGWGEGRAGTWAASRPIGQALEVASVSGNTVTFTTPFHRTYRVSQAAHLARLSDNGSQSSVHPLVTQAGVEDLAVRMTNSSGDGWGAIALNLTTSCWIKGVDVKGSNVLINGGVRNELRDSYIHESLNPSPGGAGYGIVIDTYAADNLVENDIVVGFNKVIVMRSSGGGNVVGYSYMDDAYGEQYPNQVENGLNASHMTTPHDELFEGNWGFNFSGDSTWGNSIDITAFRNHLTGRRSGTLGLASYVYTDAGGHAFYYEDGYNRRAAGAGDYHWGYNFVGNVLGTSGMALVSSPRSYYKVPQTSFAYEWTPTSDDGVVPMWKLGPMEHGTSVDRAALLATTLRDGNFDWATRAQHWHGVGGVGAAQVTPPSAALLPDSLYLTGRPAFFGASAWPWVDPASGATAVLPAKARFDAGTPNTLP